MDQRQQDINDIINYYCGNGKEDKIYLNYYQDVLSEIASQQQIQCQVILQKINSNENIQQHTALISGNKNNYIGSRHIIEYNNHVYQLCQLYTPKLCSFHFKIPPQELDHILIKQQINDKLKKILNAPIIIQKILSFLSNNTYLTIVDISKQQFNSFIVIIFQLSVTQNDNILETESKLLIDGNGQFRVIELKVVKYCFHYQSYQNQEDIEIRIGQFNNNQQSKLLIIKVYNSDYSCILFPQEDFHYSFSNLLGDNQEYQEQDQEILEKFQNIPEFQIYKTILSHFNYKSDNWYFQKEDEQKKEKDEQKKENDKYLLKMQKKKPYSLNLEDQIIVQKQRSTNILEYFNLKFL